MKGRLTDDPVSYKFIPLQAFFVHSHEHGDILINVIVYAALLFACVKTVQAPCLLDQSPFP